VKALDSINLGYSSFTMYYRPHRCQSSSRFYTIFAHAKQRFSKGSRIFMSNVSMIHPHPISKPSHKRNLWYIIGSVVLVLIIAGGYWYYQSAQQKSASAAAAQSALKSCESIPREAYVNSAASGTDQWLRPATANLAFSKSGFIEQWPNATLTKGQM